MVLGLIVRRLQEERRVHGGEQEERAGHLVQDLLGHVSEGLIRVTALSM